MTQLLQNYGHVCREVMKRFASLKDTIKFNHKLLMVQLRSVPAEPGHVIHEYQMELDNLLQAPEPNVIIVRRYCKYIL